MIPAVLYLCFDRPLSPAVQISSVFSRIQFLAESRFPWSCPALIGSEVWCSHCIAQLTKCFWDIFTSSSCVNITVSVFVQCVLVRSNDSPRIVQPHSRALGLPWQRTQAGWLSSRDLFFHGTGEVPCGVSTGLDPSQSPRAGAVLSLSPVSCGCQQLALLGSGKHITWTLLLSRCLPLGVPLGVFALSWKGLVPTPICPPLDLASKVGKDLSVVPGEPGQGNASAHYWPVGGSTLAHSSVPCPFVSPPHGEMIVCTWRICVV